MSNFYKNKEYREKQSSIMKENWKKGVFDVIKKNEDRICKRIECKNIFQIIPSDPKVYCSRSCSGKVNNVGRITSEETKLKIAKSLIGTKSPFKGLLKVPRVEVICANNRCNKLFIAIKYRNRKYCSNQCHMKVMGGKSTSAKASKGKAGIREDISCKIYFRSRWEANYARLLNYLKINWEYESKTFDLGYQNYTPDFYLPDSDEYVEVKNFLWKYSKIRDKNFRKLYPDIKLKLILSEDYLKLQNKYAKLIKNWEYKNSPFYST